MGTEQDNKAFAATDEVETALRGLNRVEAPSDFDMRLKARIANRRSSRQGFRFGFFKVAAPAALVLAAAGSGYFLLQQPSDTASVRNEQVAESPLANAAPVPDTPRPAATELTRAEPSGEPASTTVPVPQPERAAANERPRRSPEAAGPRGSSVDRAVGEPEETIYPRGIEPGRPVEAMPVMPDGEQEVAVEEVLSLLGIRATLSGGEWRVMSTDANGAAARSGVRSGDVIVSLGPTEMNARRTLRAGGSIPNIRVRRGGSIIDLKIGR